MVERRGSCRDTNVESRRLTAEYKPGFIIDALAGRVTRRGQASSHAFTSIDATPNSILKKYRHDPVPPPADEFVLKRRKESCGREPRDECNLSAPWPKMGKQNSVRR